MIEEKQIEQMACAICGNSKICCGEGIRKCILFPQMRRYANNAYKEGYRKQSEGKWRGELRTRCDWRGKKQQYFQPNSCSVCHEPAAERTPYCPHCGAKMKGKDSDEE